MNSHITITILGASVRAAAQSAVRAGFRVFTVDRFDDWDVPAESFRRVAHSPHEVLAAVNAFPSTPFIFTGGLENFPTLIARLARTRPLWGCTPNMIRRVRSPEALSLAARECGLRFPETRFEPPDSGAEERPLPNGLGLSPWLRKPWRGSGGQHVDFSSHLDNTNGVRFAKRRIYWQKFVSGDSVSAAFVANGKECRLIGETQQLIGPPWTTLPFAYAGSLAPFPVSPAMQDMWRGLGDFLVRRYGLLGLFGVDGIWDGDTLWPLEVNPRYTASMELFERAGGDAVDGNLFQMHANAVQGCLPELTALPRSVSRVFGKAIVYALRPCRISDSHCSYMQAENSANPWPLWADIPRPGTHHRSGAPVLTVFAQGNSPHETRTRLATRIAMARELLGC